MNAKDAIKMARGSAEPAPAVVESKTEPGAKTVITDSGWEPWMQEALDLCHRKFVAERTEGFIHKKTQKYYGPVSVKEAEERWLNQEPRFKETIRTDASIRESFAARHAATVTEEKEPSEE